MKVLMLTPYLPYPLLSGGQIRTYNLLKKLSSKYDVTLFALIKDEEEKKFIPELKKYCSQVKVFKRSSHPFTLSNILKTGFSTFPFLVMRNLVPEVISAVSKELKTNNYDLIHAETFYMMPHIPKTRTPIILVEQTIEYLGYESYAKKANFFLKPLLMIDIFKIKYWEKHYWNLADRLVVMSNEDKRLVAKDIRNPEKVAVVENGVDTAWFNEIKRQEPKTPTLLSVGTFKWLPNIEAVRFLVNQVWPLVKKRVPQLKLNIVGNAPTEEVLAYSKMAGISVPGRVEDIRKAFAQAHILVAPVFSGKGTRYKILEAMASGTPTVATSTAVEGLRVEHSKHVMIGNTAEELTDMIVELIENEEKRKTLAKNGKAFVRSQYDWQLISQKLDKIYQKIGNTRKK